MVELLLGVNIDYIVMLCNVCGIVYLDLVQVVFIVEQVGVDGIIVYLCEDCCYIIDCDVCILRQMLDICMNLEMVVIEEMLVIVVEMKLYFCCLVLEKCQEVIIEGGLDVVGQCDKMCDVCKCLVDVGIQVFLFIDVDEEQIKVVVEVGVLFIEIYIGCYVDVKIDVEQV